MGFSESIDVLLLTRRRSRVIRLGIGLVLLLSLIDGALCLLLRLAPQLAEGQSVRWSWASASAFLSSLSDFRHETLDLLLLYVGRTALLFLLGRLACHYGKPDYEGIEQAMERRGSARAAAGIMPLLANEIEERVATIRPTHDVRTRCQSPRVFAAACKPPAATQSAGHHPLSSSSLSITIPAWILPTPYPLLPGRVGSRPI